MSYSKQEGETKSFKLTCLPIKLLKFCNHKCIVIVLVHLPGHCNIQADSLSRPGETLLTEWSIHLDLLCPQALPILWNRIGTVYTFPPFKITPTVIAKLRQSEPITMILIAPYEMDASLMLGLLQLTQDRPIPVHDEHKPLTQVVHRTYGGAETRTYQCLNLHMWKLWKPYILSWNMMSVFQNL